LRAHTPKPTALAGDWAAHTIGKKKEQNVSCSVVGKYRDFEAIY
jgi:hypothetical protein